MKLDVEIASQILADEEEEKTADSRQCKVAICFEEYSADIVEGDIIYDIETEPLDPDVLEKILPPFKPSDKEPPGEFDPSLVKYGNAKKADTRQRTLEAARERHELKVREFEGDQKQAEENYYRDARKGATLRPTRSKVCTIQLSVAGSGQVDFLCGEEVWMLTTFWDIAERCQHSSRKMVGFNTHKFDLPYMYRRSIINGDIPPLWVMTNDRYWNEIFVDIAKKWALGSTDSKSYVTLDELSSALGHGNKRCGLTGSMFHEFWNGTEEQREEAIKYGANDVLLTEMAAISLGVIDP